MKLTNILTLTAVLAVSISAPAYAVVAKHKTVINSASATYKATTNVAPRKKVATYTMSQVDCLAINSFKEASIGTEKEQRLVDSVVLNRVLLSNGQSNACGEVFKPYQFSWTNNVKHKAVFTNQGAMLAYYKVDATAFKKLTSVAIDVMLEHDVTSYKKTQPTMYHDNSVKGFGKINTKKIKVVARTKNFVWYTTTALAGVKLAAK